MTLDIEALIEEISSSKVHDTREIKEMEIGQVVRQGDIYITKVPSNHKKGPLKESHQLATGTSKGSRHEADRNFLVYEGVKIPSGFEEGTFLGPCIVTSKGGTITHPEHAWCKLPKGTYQITHQTDLRTRQRARD